MSLGYFEVFGMAADCIQVLIGALIVILLVRLRKKPPVPDGSAWASSEANPFRLEFQLQSLKHQSELAFQQIEKTIQVERSNLIQLFQLGDKQIPEGDADLFDEDLKGARFKIDPAPPPDTPEPSGNRYRQVAKLAADGLNPGRIAKQLGVPLGEVDLVLKLAAASEPENTDDSAARNGRQRRTVRQ